jgi:hypothetical protein
MENKNENQDIKNRFGITQKNKNTLFKKYVKTESMDRKSSPK